MNLPSTAPCGPAPALPANAESAWDPLACFRKYNEFAASLEGWFGPPAIALWDALLVFQRERGIRGPMLEIGVWRGRSAALLALHAEPNSKLFLCDYKFHGPSIHRALELARPDKDLELVRIDGDSTNLHVHDIAREQFRKLRWMHIDGEHSARAVTSDMRAANTLLAPDGVLVIDDFFSWQYPQVTEAVLRYVRTQPEDFALFLCGYNKAYLARPHAVHRYLEYVANDLGDALAARGVDATLAKTTYPAEMNTFGVGPRRDGLALRGPDWEERTIRY